MKYLLAVCTAFFLASCSNEDEPQQPQPQHGDIVGLNIKDAKYIYTSGGNTRSSSSSAEYRQIKKDGRDIELSWIDSKGDTIKIGGQFSIWDINKKYLMITTGSPINYKPVISEDGMLEVVEKLGGYSYLINKETEAIYYLGEDQPGLNGENAVTDNKGNIYVKTNYAQTIRSPRLYKIHTEDISNLKLELYADNSQSFVVNNKGTCFYGYRYIRPSYGTQQFIISSFIPQAEYGNAFVSHDNEDIYITAITSSIEERKSSLIVSKLTEDKEIQSEVMAKLSFDGIWQSQTPNYIQVKWNERRGTMLIHLNRTYEYLVATKTLTEIPVDLSGFFAADYSIYVTTNALYAQKSVNKLDIISLEDYSTKTLDLSGKGIDFRSIYTMNGSDLLYFAGFQYSSSQSVIGTIDIDGNVEITKSTPNSITNIIQIN